MLVTNKVRAGFAFLLLILAVVGVISYRIAAQVRETSRRVEHTLKALGTLKDSAASLGELNYAQRSYILTGQREYLESYRTAETTLNQEVMALRDLTADNPAQQRRLDELNGVVAQRIAVAKQGIQSRDEQGFDAALEHVKSGRGTRLSDSIRKIIREMEGEEVRLLDQRQQRAEESSDAAIAVTGYGTLAAFLFVSVTSVLIVRNITTPVGRLVRATEQIGSGTLGYRVAAESEDELGALAKAFNGMAARLQVAQEELQHRTNVLHLVLNSIADGVVVADTAGKFLFFNSAAEQILRTGPTDSGLHGWTERCGFFRH